MLEVTSKNLNILRLFTCYTPNNVISDLNCVMHEVTTTFPTSQISTLNYDILCIMAIIAGMVIIIRAFFGIQGCILRVKI
ncbi:MAG: hypothetical protein AB8U40_02075 [Anaplasma ovis]